MILRFIITVWIMTSVMLAILHDIYLVSKSEPLGGWKRVKVFIVTILLWVPAVLWVLLHNED